MRLPLLVQPVEPVLRGTVAEEVEVEIRGGDRLVTILCHDNAAKIPHHDVSDRGVQDRRDGLHYFANLYFNPRNAMLLRLHRWEHRELIVLRVSAAVLDVTTGNMVMLGYLSTYLTGTLTNLIASVAVRSPLATMLPSAQLLASLIVGADVGALVVVRVEWLAPVLLVLPLVVVIVLSVALRRTER